MINIKLFKINNPTLKLDVNNTFYFRHKVKDFAQITANSQRADGKKCPRFKLIILDEADSMTKSAQVSVL